MQVNTVVGVIDAEGSAAAVKAPAKPPAPGEIRTAKPRPRPMGLPLQSSLRRQNRQRPCRKRKLPAGANGGAATEVVMPQMGESIFEGTITKWLKKVGDKVQRDEPLFEISTDKVDAEIPAPAAGVLREIKVKEGATVQVNSVVAVIGGAGAPGKAAPAQAAPAKAAAASAQPQAAPQQPSQPQPQQPQQVVGFPAAIAGMMASVYAPHRWCAAWRVRTTLISARSRAPAWAGASARAISKALSSSMAQGGGRPQVVSRPPQARPAQQSARHTQRSTRHGRPRRLPLRCCQANWSP